LRLANFTLGVRPEYVRLSADQDAVRLARRGQRRCRTSAPTGCHRQVGAEPGAPLKARLPFGAGDWPQVGEQVWMQVVGAHTCYYVNEELIA
jgi:glycerol transport system ATP-binding protein